MSGEQLVLDVARPRLDDAFVSRWRALEGQHGTKPATLERVADVTAAGARWIVVVVDRRPFCCLSSSSPEHAASELWVRSGRPT